MVLGGLLFGVIAISLILVGYSKGGKSADEINAEAFHRRAMELVELGNYPLALAHFRAAVRHNDKSVLYWSDLGVTEMRMGALDKALKRFQRALSIDPTSSLALDNLQEIHRFLPPSVGSTDGIVQPHQHNVIEPVVISAEAFAELAEDAGRSSQLLRAPFVVKNAFTAFGITAERIEAIFNRKFLTERFGDRIVDFYPHNMIEEQAHPYFLAFGPALFQLLNKPEEAYVGVDASEPGTYIQWNLDQDTWREFVVDLLGGKLPPLLNDRWWMDHCFGDTTSITVVDAAGPTTTASLEPTGDNTKHQQRQQYPMASRFMLATHWQMLLIGEKGAGMFNHQDTLRAASWQLQIVGAKKWHLCGPKQSPFLYAAGKVDLFAPDYAKYPLLHNATCTEVTLQAGDLLYYPPDYWHQTVNLETPSIALSGTLVTLGGYKGLTEELRRECAGAHRIFAPQLDLCAALESCYALWGRRHSS